MNTHIGQVDRKARGALNADGGTDRHLKSLRLSVIREEGANLKFQPQPSFLPPCLPGRLRLPLSERADHRPTSAAADATQIEYRGVIHKKKNVLKNVLKWNFDLETCPNYSNFSLLLV